MNPVPKEVIANIFCNVLEKVAFIFAEVVDKEKLCPSSSNYIQTQMYFQGQISGKVSLIIPNVVIPEISANMLGIETEDNRAIIRGEDAFKELLNITCSHILTALIDEKAVFDLSIPELCKIDRDAWIEILRQPETLGFLVDDKPFLLNLKITGD